MKNIFIISKEIKIIHILSAFLRSHTYSTNSATDLNNAAKLIAEKQFDLIIMDMSSRLESIDRFYHDNLVGNKKVPTLYLCDIPSKGNFLRGLHLNTNSFMFKPFKQNELIKMLNTLLTRQDHKK